MNMHVQEMAELFRLARPIIVREDRTLQDILNDGLPLNSNKIINATCVVFKITRKEILGRERTMRESHARTAAMWCMRNFLPRGSASYNVISKKFDDRDHTTARHLILLADELLAKYEAGKCSRAERQFVKRFERLVSALTGINSYWGA